MKRSNILWTLILVAALLIGLLALAYALAPYSAVKGALDGITPDGNFERLSAAVYAANRPWIGVVGAVGLALAAFFLLWRKRSQALVRAALDSMSAYWRHLRSDTRRYLSDLWARRLRGGDWYGLLAIIVVGAVLRALLMDRPIQHDEAYTFIAFVSRGARQVISDYHLPNNHVFHTLQVFFSYKLFGEAPWALRLPAYLAGVALIPAAYAAGRMAFNRYAGLAAAGLVAANMHLIHYSTEARGYSLVALLAVLIWVLAMQLLLRPNRFAWLLLTLAAALGFWTMPTMLYPYGGIMLWMAATWLLQDRGRGYPTLVFWRDYISSGLVSAALTLLLYTPIFLNWGFAAVFNNGIVASMVDEVLSEFFENLGARWGDAWAAWNEGIAPLLVALAVLAFGLALFAHWRNRRWKLPLPVVLFVFVLGLMLVQRVVGWVRVWTFALPFYLIYVGAGVSLLGGLVEQRSRPGMRGVVIGVLAASYLIATAVWISRPGDNAAELRGAPGEIERASLFLSERVTEDDVIAVISPDGPAFWYYTRQLGIDPQLFEVLRQDLDQVYVVLNTESLQTVERVLELRNALLDRVDLAHDELLHSSRVIEIHQLPIIR